MLPAVVIAAVATAATVAPLDFLLAVGAVAVISVPFTLMGLAIGYSLSSKAAIVVAQLVFFPLAFGGGLLSNPDDAPGFIKAIAPTCPPGARWNSCGRRSPTGDRTQSPSSCSASGSWCWRGSPDGRTDGTRDGALPDLFADFCPQVIGRCRDSCGHGTFLITTTLFLVVLRTLWHWFTRRVVLFAVVFGGIERAFFTANLAKVGHGG
ncbi:KUP/HAK/KT family potassium transporter [Micromonospora sp. NPDC007230]|uniref:KUP/HAK/KT family potassium transporter n=1 Tax=Micromonospora sp. NPDC007230 TaxID=3364237 RepID=UPI00368D36FE